MKTAIISACKQYRYSLTRTVGDSKKCCVFIMLNPSTANATEDDATIRRCIGYAKNWSCGELSVVNLFAYRAKKPVDMMAADDPIGQYNDHHIALALARIRGLGGYAICAWGNRGQYKDRNIEVLKILREMKVDPHFLELTHNKQPGHPLYLSKTLTPIKMEIDQ